MPKLNALSRSIGSDRDSGLPENMADAGFRVEVDLSEYFQVPAHCLLWVGVGSEQRVRCLGQRLQNAAGLRKPFCLMCGVFTLPPGEPLRILNAGDTLRVVPVQHKWQRAFSFGADETDVETTDEMALSLSNQHAPNVGEKKTRKRRKRDSIPTSPPLVDDSQKESVAMESESPSAPEPTPVESDEALQRVKQRALALLNQVQESWEGDNSNLKEEAPRKRRRHRVRKRRTPAAGSFEPEAVEPLSETVTEPDLQSVTESEPITEVTPTPQIKAVALMSPPEVLRNVCAPRAPRLVRSISNASETRCDQRLDGDPGYNQSNDAERPPTPTPPASAPAPPAVPCN